MFKINKIFSQGGRFGTLSATSFCLTLMGSAIGHELLLWPEEIAYLVTLIIVFVINFFGMRYYVYPNNRNKNIVRQFLEFLVTSFGFRFSEYMFFLILHTWLDLQYLVTIILVMTISSVSKFIFYRFAVFD